MHSVVRHPLPGRLRFALRAIHQNREAACALEERLGALDGVALVRVFPERGQVSVRFNPGQIDAKALLAEALSFSATWEQVARSQGPTPGELALSVLAPGVLLAAVAGKRALSGPSPASQAPELSFAAAAVGAAAGYPLLRQGLKRAGGPRTEAWLAYSGLGLLLVRESVSGLAALLLLNLTRWLERDALTKAYAEAAAAQQAEAPGIQPPMPALEDEPASMTQAALGVAAATTLGTRDLGRGLAVLIAALPRVRELASSLTSSQAMAALANHGVIPSRKRRCGRRERSTRPFSARTRFGLRGQRSPTS